MAAAERIAISIDLGGTQYRVAAVSSHGDILARFAGASRAEAPADVVIDDLVAAVGKVRQEIAGQDVLSLGVAAPGPIDEAARKVLVAPNFPLWKDVPLADRLEAATGLPAYLGNDAKLAALGEYRFGAGRGSRHMVYLTVSTGVGAGCIVDGKLVTGSRGAAGEAGHMQIAFDGPRCSCGNRGCLEAFTSGHGLVRQARDAIKAGAQTVLSQQGSGLTAVDIGRAAGSGDQFASDLIKRAGVALGVGVRNLIHLFDPTVVVIGGGVSLMGPILWLPMLETVAADPYAAFHDSARVLPAELRDDPGLVGAAVMVFEPEALGLPPHPARA